MRKLMKAKRKRKPSEYPEGQHGEKLAWAASLASFITALLRVVEWWRQHFGG